MSKIRRRNSSYCRPIPLYSAGARRITLLFYSYFNHLPALDMVAIERAICCLRLIRFVTAPCLWVSARALTLIISPVVVCFRLLPWAETFTGGTHTPRMAILMLPRFSSICKRYNQFQGFRLQGVCGTEFLTRIS